MVGVTCISSEGVFSYNKDIVGSSWLEPPQSMESTSKESDKVQELFLEDLFESLKQRRQQLFKKAK